MVLSSPDLSVYIVVTAPYMLIPLSWHFVDLWLKEEYSVQSGCTMEQILWVLEMKTARIQSNAAR